MSFFVFIFDAIFGGSCFFVFQEARGFLRNLDVFIVVPLINSTGLAIVAESDLRCDKFLSEKGCRHKLVVSTSFCYCLLNVSSVSTSLKYTATVFWVIKALWVCLRLYGSTKFLTLVFMFLKYVIFCVYP